jgi:CheY-like chemotaxis protein
MPIMDGKSSLRALRAHPRFADLPVCVYTTGVNPREGPQCLDLGADTYTIKANSVIELRAFLEGLVEKYTPGVH